MRDTSSPPSRGFAAGALGQYPRLRTTLYQLYQRAVHMRVVTSHRDEVEDSIDVA